jgi:hypothetical protein
VAGTLRGDAETGQETVRRCLLVPRLWRLLNKPARQGEKSKIKMKIRIRKRIKRRIKSKIRNATPLAIPCSILLLIYSYSSS